jgi:hypothetical protein
MIKMKSKMPLFTEVVDLIKKEFLIDSQSCTVSIRAKDDQGKFVVLSTQSAFIEAVAKTRSRKLLNNPSASRYESSKVMSYRNCRFSLSLYIHISEHIPTSIVHTTGTQFAYEIVLEVLSQLCSRLFQEPATELR